MEDFKNIAPKLSKIKKENPFGVPANYFDDFNARLQSKLNAGSELKKQNPVIRYLKPALGLAASFAIIFMLVYWPLNNFNSKQSAQNISNMPDANIENQYIAMLEEVDDNSLFALLENGYEDEAISDNELVNYLSTNLSDYDIYLESKQLNSLK